MTSDIIMISGVSLLGIGIVAASLLRGWQGWLQLKTRELDNHRPEIERSAGSGAARIELADLRERIRKLEAIAAGVDL